MNPSLNTAGVQLGPDTVTLASPDRIDVVDVPRASRLDRCVNVSLSEKARIHAGVPAPELGPRLEPPQLDSQDCRLDLIEAEVESSNDVQVLLLGAPVAKHAQLLRIAFVVGGHRTAVAGSTEVLAGVEAETAQVADRARWPVPVPGAVRLGGVL